MTALLEYLDLGILKIFGGGSRAPFDALYLPLTCILLHHTTKWLTSTDSLTDNCEQSKGNTIKICCTVLLVDVSPAVHIIASMVDPGWGIWGKYPHP